MSDQALVRQGAATLVHADCMHWPLQQEPNSIHAVVTDPPYGLLEYTSNEQAKLVRGRGGVSPVPRFTVLTPANRAQLAAFFREWAERLLPVLAPGANVVVAANPLLSYLVAGALADGGLERRGEIVRLVSTMRGGDRPKGAHEEFAEVSAMPRSMWEPWLAFRKPLGSRKPSRAAGALTLVPAAAAPRTDSSVRILADQ